MSRSRARIGCLGSFILLFASYLATGAFGFQRATADPSSVPLWNLLGGLGLLAGLVFLVLLIRGPHSSDS